MSISTETHVHKGTKTKVERYGWTVIDEPGTPRLIVKQLLLVDESYQRVATAESKIKAIAAAWSWVACGSITVGSRNGAFYVIDGQYRTLAARRRADIEVLPCLVFATAGAEQEAAGFLAANTQRRPITSVDRHRALVIVGDEAAIHCQTLIEASGRDISRDSRPTTFACLTMLRKHVTQNQNTLDALWPTMLLLCDGEVFHEQLLDGLMFLETHIADGKTLTAGKWQKRLLKIGYSELLKGIKTASAAYARGSAKICAIGILAKLNHGVRDNLEMELT